MATNASFLGFHPHNDHGGTSVQLIRRRVASNNGTAIFKGDVIDYTAAGVVGIATAGSGGVGSSQGASYYDSTIGGRRENPYLPASTTYASTAFDDHGETDESFLYITADPVNAVFRAQYSASTPALTDLTKNANFAAGAGGSTTTGISSHALDQTTLATTAALDFRITDFLHNVLSDPAQASAHVLVKFNLGKIPPFNAAGTAGK